MTKNIHFKSQEREFTAQRPVVTSYDSGFEHSLEHWIDLRCMVDHQQEEDSMAVGREELVATA